MTVCARLRTYYGTSMNTHYQLTHPLFLWLLMPLFTGRWEGTNNYNSTLFVTVV